MKNYKHWIADGMMFASLASRGPYGHMTGYSYWRMSKSYAFHSYIPTTWTKSAPV